MSIEEAIAEIVADLGDLGEYKPPVDARQLRTGACPKCGAKAAWLIPHGWRCLGCGAEYRVEEPK